MMSGMDDRAKRFKTAAESQLTGPALNKEINTLRRFLFRNQEYRFTKAAQQALYMAILAHYGNAAAHHASGLPVPVRKTTPTANTLGPSELSSSSTSLSGGESGKGAAASKRLDNNDEVEDREEDGAQVEAPILRLLDDALKMPFTVFTSSQKDKLLSMYWAVLGTEGPPGGSGNGNNAASGGGLSSAAVITRHLSLMDIVDAGKNKATLSLFTDDGDEYAQEVAVDDADTLRQLKKEFDEGNAVTVMVQETDNGACFLSFLVSEEE